MDMSPNKFEVSIQTTREDYLIAWFTALAITIYLLEHAFPSPLPGIKLGFANIVVIVVLLKFGWRISAWVNLLRVIVGSLIMGSFLSPTFVLSFSGALASTLVLILLSFLPGKGCSGIGYSIAAAMVHVIAQIWVAYLFFIPHAGIFKLLPILMTTAFLFGLFNGLIATIVVEKLQNYN